MMKYSGKIKYTLDNLFILSETISKSFKLPLRILDYTAGAMLILFGLLSGFNTPALLSFIAVGCFLITGITGITRARAKNSFASVGKKALELSYEFVDSGFRCSYDDKSDFVEYSRLIRLVSDRKFFYIFCCQNAAYMVSWSSIQPASKKAFQDFLSEKTGQRWMSDRAIQNLRNTIANFFFCKK